MQKKPARKHVLDCEPQKPENVNNSNAYVFFVYIFRAVVILGSSVVILDCLRLMGELFDQGEPSAWYTESSMTTVSPWAGGRSEKERIIENTAQRRWNRVKQWKQMPLVAGKRNFLAVRVVILLLFCLTLAVR